MEAMSSSEAVHLAISMDLPKQLGPLQYAIAPIVKTIRKISDGGSGTAVTDTLSICGPVNGSSPDDFAMIERSVDEELATNG